MFRTIQARLAKLSLFEKLWLGTPVAVWFSYRPLILLGRNQTTNFELSITLIYLAAMGLAGLPVIWQARRDLVRQPAAWILGAFGLICILSLAWTPNPARGILTAGVIGLVMVIFWASIERAKHIKPLLPLMARIFITIALLMSALAWAQMLAGIWLSRSQALLCAGCTARQLGFVRPDGLTIEPQFLGNLLIVPVLLLIHGLMVKNPRAKLWWPASFILITLFLTLSRGAIFGFGLGLLAMVLVTRPAITRLVRIAAVIGGCLVTCLLIQASTAAINPKLDVSFRQAAAASLNQLTLGVIDVRAKPVPKSTSSVTKTQSVTTQPVAGQAAKPNYNGYIKESTDVRVKLSRLALTSWHKTPPRTVFGVGLGGSGLVLHQEYPKQVHPREIIQNEYIEILYENGLVGLGLFVGLITGLLYSLRQQRWLWSVVIAFVVQWNFFSGYPNALHIYLILTLLFVASGPKPAKV